MAESGKNQLYAFSAADVERLRAVIRDYELTGGGTPRHQPPRGKSHPSDCEFGKADAVIAGTTTVTPASGTVSVWSFTSTGGTTDTGQNVTAYNLSDRDITRAGWVTLHRHYRSRKWIVTQGANTALAYYGLLQGALATGDATHTVDGLEPLDASVGTTATSLTVSNRLAWSGDDNGPCYVIRNMSQGTWDFIQIKCT